MSVDLWGKKRTHISLHFIIISISLIRKKACLVWVRTGISFFRFFPPLWVLYPHISGLLPVGRVLSTFRIGGTGTDASALRGWLKGGRFLKGKNVGVWLAWIATQLSLANKVEGDFIKILNKSKVIEFFCLLVCFLFSGNSTRKPRSTGCRVCFNAYSAHSTS